MQGFNMGRYHAPSSLDPSLGADKSRTSSSKLSRTKPGAQIVRFEMPFAIWCGTCPSHSPNALIGQGVRFNAEKQRVGSYFSTPLWAFRMKHGACGGWIEIRTDPKNSEYVVADGAKRRDTGEDEVVAARTGGVLLVGKDDEEKRRRDAFAALEGKMEDRGRAKSEAARLEELRSLKERDWRDVDAANARLRREFRAGRKEREKEEERSGALMDKMSLGIELVAETKEDRMRAALVEFGADAGLEGGPARLTPVFPVADGKSGKDGNGRPLSPRSRLRLELHYNTRASQNPFGEDAPRAFRPVAIPLKRKRKKEDNSIARDNDRENKTWKDGGSIKTAGIDDEITNQELMTSKRMNDDAMNEKPIGKLVDYDSDSD